MKIDFSVVLLTLDEKPIQSGGECSKCGHATKAEDLTLESVAIASLFNAKADEKAEDKLKRYMLAQRIKQYPTVDLSSKDITFLCEAISATFGPLVYGRATEILDPSEIKELKE